MPFLYRTVYGIGIMFMLSVLGSSSYWLVIFIQMSPMAMTFLAILQMCHIGNLNAEMEGVEIPDPP